MKTTTLIHDLEMRRDSFLRLQEEGKKGKAGFVKFEDIQNMEQVQKWTTSKVLIEFGPDRSPWSHDFCPSVTSVTSCL